MYGRIRGKDTLDHSEGRLSVVSRRNDDSRPKGKVDESAASVPMPPLVPTHSETFGAS